MPWPSDGPSKRSAESSETIRQTRWWNVREDMVRSVWRHTEAGRNDRPLRQLNLAVPLVGEGYGRVSESNKMPKVAKALVG